MNYFVYILRCCDGTFYTGYTTNLARRIKEHNGKGSGAKYTRGRRPVELIYSEEFMSLREALQRELTIKKLTRNQKLRLITS